MIDTNGIKVQRVDGVMVIKLPEGMTAKDFEDLMNNHPNRDELRFEELPEKWTSIEQDET